jgi:DNA-directed RNA polymerase specialized sigma subunit
MARFYTDAHFKLFYSNVQLMIMGLDSSADEDFNANQKKHVESLVKAERRFKAILQKHTFGPWVYKQFIEFIVNNNILAARPYFRERQKKFSSGISPAISKRKYKRLYKFGINYPFIVFVLGLRKWGERSPITKAAKEVLRIRNDIITANIPLAVSRAKIFRQKTPEGHLQYMDLIQVACEGLCNAVDKFVLPYTPVFRAVIIGRATGDMIDNLNDTMLHFFPSDKRKIYRANKFNRGSEDLNYGAMAHSVNDGIGSNLNTNADEIRNLTMAANHYSLDMPICEVVNGCDEKMTVGDGYTGDESLRPDVAFESAQVNSVLYSSIDNLDLVERKLLALKGVRK